MRMAEEFAQQKKQEGCLIVATIYWAAPEEKQEIIDFIDLVFSKAHRPHDFATLIPKANFGPPSASSMVSGQDEDC